MMNNNVGIYIHIPFCLKKCNYCDFISFSSYEFEENYFKKLLKEIDIRNSNTKKIKTKKEKRKPSELPGFQLPTEIK